METAGVDRELMSTMDGLVYAERVCVTDVPNLVKAKRAMLRRKYIGPKEKHLERNLATLEQGLACGKNIF